MSYLIQPIYEIVITVQLGKIFSRLVCREIELESEHKHVSFSILQSIHV